MKTSQRTTKNDLERPKIQPKTNKFYRISSKDKICIFLTNPFVGRFPFKNRLFEQSKRSNPVIFETKANIKGKYEQSRT